MPRKREPTSKQTATTDKRRPAARKPARRKPATRKPRQSPELREAAEQHLVRVEELDARSRPLREAAEAELEKTASGRKLLKEAQALGDELNALYQDIASAKTGYEEGHRRARRRREEFSDRHGEQLLEVQARVVGLRPSVEAVAQVLHPEVASDVAWATETSLREGMMLKPKPEPEDIATVERGIDVPQPVQTCLRPPYPRREDYAFGTPFAFVEGRSEVDGHCVLDTLVVSTWTFIGLGAIPQVGTSTAWVGGDFPVPDGISSYEVTVDYDWSCLESAYAVIGTAVAGGGVEIQIDRGDGTPAFEIKDYSFGDKAAVVAAGDYPFDDSGHRKTTVPFTRAVPIAGTVRVMVGVGGHGEAWGFLAGASFWDKLFVREICLNSAV